MDCTCETIPTGGRRVDPACPEHRPVEDIIGEVLGPLVEQVRGKIFRPECAAGKTRGEVLGVIVSKFLEWDGDEILRVAAEALEDANFHDEASAVRAL